MGEVKTKPRTFLIKDLFDDTTFVWTVEQMLEEINRERSWDWEKYDSKDFMDGWNEWIEGNWYTIIEETK